jgi:hypothetical protein
VCLKRALCVVFMQQGLLLRLKQHLCITRTLNMQQATAALRALRKQKRHQLLLLPPAAPSAATAPLHRPHSRICMQYTSR